MDDLRTEPWPAEHIAELRTYHNPCGWSCVATADYRECEIARWLATLDAATPEPTLDVERLRWMVEQLPTVPGDYTETVAFVSLPALRDILARLHERTASQEGATE